MFSWKNSIALMAFFLFSCGKIEQQVINLGQPFDIVGQEVEVSLLFCIGEILVKETFYIATGNSDISKCNINYIGLTKINLSVGNLKATYDVPFKISSDRCLWNFPKAIKNFGTYNIYSNKKYKIFLKTSEK